MTRWSRNTKSGGNAKKKVEAKSGGSGVSKGASGSEGGDQKVRPFLVELSPREGIVEGEKGGGEGGNRKVKSYWGGGKKVNQRNRWSV